MLLVFIRKYCRLLDSIKINGGIGTKLVHSIAFLFQCRSKISDLEHTLTQVIKENQVEKETTSKKYERDMEKSKFVFRYFVGKKIGWVDSYEFPKFITPFLLHVG